RYLPSFPTRRSSDLTTPLLGESPAPAKAGERRRLEITFELTVAVGDLFIDLSVFEFDQGSYTILDARLGVLHLAVTSLSYCEMRSEEHTSELQSPCN